MHKILLKLTLPLALLLAFSAAQAEDSDSFSGNINLSVSNLVRISKISDLHFGSYSGSNNFSKNANVCIWTNQSGGSYKVRAHGDGNSNAFIVTNASANTLPYSVRWNDSTDTIGNISLSADVTSAAFSGASTTAIDCGGGVNANFEVSFSESDLLAARPGTYTGVLTLIISPNS